jgi:adenine/guanine phosphoribosyltransferase-like PRPP-binding protein
MAFDLDKAIRKIPDFPKEGVLFYDITSILTNVEAYNGTEKICPGVWRRYY